MAAGVRPVAVFGPEHGFRGSAQAGGSEGTTPIHAPAFPSTTSTAWTRTRSRACSPMPASTRSCSTSPTSERGSTPTSGPCTRRWSPLPGRRGVRGAGQAQSDRRRRGRPLLDPEYSSFVGLKPIAQQHGMTVGELARFFDAEFLPDAGGRLDELDHHRQLGGELVRVGAGSGVEAFGPLDRSGEAFVVGPAGASGAVLAGTGAAPAGPATPSHRARLQALAGPTPSQEQRRTTPGGYAAPSVTIRAAAAAPACAPPGAEAPSPRPRCAP